MTARRILVLGTIPDRSEAALLERLARAGRDVHAVFQPRAQRLDALRTAGVGISFAELRWESRRTDAATVSSLVRERAPDVIHVLRSKSLRLLRQACSPPWPPTVFYRGTIESPRWWSWSDRRKFFDPNIVRYLAVSEAVRRALLDGGVPPARIAVLRKGHDPSWYQVPAIDFRAELGLRRTTFLLGVVANIRWEKGVEFAVAAAHRLADAGRDVHLALLGDDERHGLRRRLRPLSAPGRVTHVGPRSDVAAILPSFDVLLLPSLREGSPRAVAEAMMRSVPVVASNVGGVPELLDGGRVGRLVEAADVAGMARAIAELMDDDAERRRIGALGRAHVEELLSLERVTQQALAIYDEVASASREAKSSVMTWR